VLVLSETALVLVIESSLQWCYVRSTRDLALNAIKLFPLSTDKHEHEHEHEHETGPESESYWPLFFLNSRKRVQFDYMASFGLDSPSHFYRDF
jgi:hypothetical protein